MKLELSLQVLFLVTQHLTVEARSRDNCLFSRLDVTPCTNPRITLPGQNQYGIYSTRLKPGSDGNPICRIRKRGQIIRDIDVAGSSVKLLYSPGMELFPRVNYLDQTLVDYHVKCDSGETAFVGFLSQDIEPENCFDSSFQKFRCRDYIEIDGGSSGVTETCGPYPNTSLLLSSGHFHVRMRTSVAGRFPGFTAYVICFRNAAPRPSNKGCNNVPNKSVQPDSPLGSKARQVGIRAGELSVVEDLVSSLLDNAYMNARNRNYQWPPREFFEDDDESELPTHSPGDLEPIDIFPIRRPDEPIIQPPSRPPRLEDPIGELPVIRPRLDQRFKRARLVETAVGLREDMAVQALRFEEACNPIVQATTRSYLTTYNRLDRQGLEIIRTEFREEELEQLRSPIRQ